MDAATIYGRKQRLKKAIDKSLNTKNLVRSGKLSSFDKQKIKKAAVGAFKQFAIKELNTPNIKTYDFWFTMFYGKVEYTMHQQNNLGKNRYFIIDEDGAETPITNDHSFASTSGSMNVKEFEVYSHEISTMISSNNKLFSELLRITVSEKEDRKIYAAYDNVNEKKIIMATIGLPVAIIGALEALPFVLAYGESTALPALGKAFAVNSGRTALANGVADGVGQYTSNLLSTGEIGVNNFKKIDLFNMATSATLSGFLSTPLKSEFDYTWGGGFKANNLEKFSENMIFSGFSKKATGSFSNTIGKPMSTFGGNVGKLFDYGGQFTIKTVISAGKKELGKENSPE